MLENVDRFPYLGSYLSNSANIDVEIQHRIRCACFSYSRLKDRVFSERGFRTATNILEYKAVILTTLWLWDVGSLPSPCENARTVPTAHTQIYPRCPLDNRITNASILEQADTTSIEAHIVKSHLSWAGHVRRMPDTRVPKQLLYAELSSGKRKTGGQWKRNKDQLKANLKKCEMELQWENRADDRACWRRTSRMGAANLEQRRITMEAQKRERRKNRENDNDTADSRPTSCLCNVFYKLTHKDLL